MTEEAVPGQASLAPSETPKRQASALVVERLELANWRNLARATVAAHPAFNVFHGDNAQGKTNLLEAVYLVSRLKSFRDVRLGDLVTHGQPAGRVEARVRRVAGRLRSITPRQRAYDGASDMAPPGWIACLANVS